MDLSGNIDAQYSFDSQGRSLEGIPPDISRISFENENTNTSGGQIKQMINTPTDAILHGCSMDETGSGSNRIGGGQANLSQDVHNYEGKQVVVSGVLSSSESSQHANSIG